MPKVDILGVKIDNLSFNQTLGRVEELVEEGRRGRSHFIVKPNPEIVTYASRNKKFKKILNSASLAPPDGVGLILASKELKERVGGSELMEAILRLAQRMDFSVFFYGAERGVVSKLVEVVKKRHPKLNIVGFNDGFSKSDTEIIVKIKKVNPDILFVALGFPKQERWIYNNIEELNVPLSIAEGGSFDFISGKTPHAPRFISNAGLEWLFRLIIEPRRIRRQMALLKFVWLILKNRG